MSDALPSAAVLLGQTAVGKTTISLRVAERFNAEIINVDSTAFYRGMDVGTAKPTPVERLRVRHHLVDIADPADTITLGQFKDMAYDALADITARGKLPLVTGGSGLYIHAVVKNYRIPEVTPNPALREKLEARAERIGAEAFHAELVTVDPKAAAKIHPNNVRRVVRALEVYHATGEPISEQKGHGPRLYDFTLIGLERDSDDLYTRIDRRIQRMFERGWRTEVRRLLAEGVDPVWPSMAAIGYRELAAVERGAMALEAAIDRMQKTTRKFARHQKTWFTRDDMPVQWVHAEATNKVEALLAKKYGTSTS